MKKELREAEAGLIEAGLKWAGSCLRKVSEEYTVDVYIGEHLWMELHDTHVGFLTKAIVARCMGLGWSWGDGLAYTRTLVTNSELVSRVMLKAETYISHVRSLQIFSDERTKQEYLLAKLVHVKDATRFIELAQHVDQSRVFLRRALMGIVSLHGGDILRVVKNAEAAEELIK